MEDYDFCKEFFKIVEERRNFVSVLPSGKGLSAEDFKCDLSGLDPLFIWFLGEVLSHGEVEPNTRNSIDLALSSFSYEGVIEAEKLAKELGVEEMFLGGEYSHRSGKNIIPRGFLMKVMKIRKITETQRHTTKRIKNMVVFLERLEGIEGIDMHVLGGWHENRDMMPLGCYFRILYQTRGISKSDRTTDSVLKNLRAYLKFLSILSDKIRKNATKYVSIGRLKACNLKIIEQNLHVVKSCPKLLEHVAESYTFDFFCRAFKDYIK